jgi:hypothetical protein
MTYERYQNGLPTDNGSPSPGEIQSDLTEIRGEMSETLDQIGAKLEPKQLVGQVMSSFSSEGGRRVYESVLSSIKRNPIPCAMIAGGVGYLVYSEINGRGSTPNAAKIEGSASSSSVGSEASKLMDGATTGAREAVSRVRGLAGEAGDKAGRMFGRASTTVKEGAANVREHPMVLAGLGLALGAALAAMTKA